MTTAVVLAMHGAPANDFPPGELAEFFRLHARAEGKGDGTACGGEPGRGAGADRFTELESRIRRWPRTTANDPYHAASYDLARRLGEASGLEVVVGFNEFCAPDLDEALDRAASRAERVVVVTTMMTAGGEHAEEDIPAAVDRARVRNPAVAFVYAWPFEPSGVAAFLAAQIERFSR
jgi:sirohydrochlorin cobaltochelatase